MAKVFVEPIGITIEVAETETLFKPLVNAAVAIPTDCGGRGTCGKCLVRLGAGELSPPSAAELKLIPAERLHEGWRLACQASPVSAKVSIEVRETRGRRQILTASKLHHGPAHSAVSRRTLQLDKPTLEDARSDLSRIVDALPRVEVPYDVLQRAPDVLRANGWRAIFTTYGRRLVDVEPPQEEETAVAYGAAVDIGTSKIVAYLFDLNTGKQIDQEAIENPQMRYGEDVITRIAQAEGAARAELAAAARQGVNDCLKRLYRRQRITARQVLDMTVVGNTAIHHLTLGLPAQGLGQAPYAPVVAAPLTVRAAELGLDIHPAAGVYFPPPIAGFVGSDCLAVVAATRLAGKRKPSMAIDIGTNTEIALSVGGEVMVTSCASGPAFEGYQTRSGMKAVEGAIERISIAADGHPTRLETIGGAPPLGICGSGVVDLLAGLAKAEVINQGGRMVEHRRVREGDHGREYFLETGPAGDIVFTQGDVRALQLAKAAIAAGWALLLKRAGVAIEDLDRVYVAGAFGNYLDVHHSLDIGLFPPVGASRISFVGNAAGVGAQMALIDVGARKRMARLRARMRFLELATDKEFLEEFTARLGF
ncbi:MAG: ASKHA domain-containing protein [Thermoleophilia bacterium]